MINNIRKHKKTFIIGVVLLLISLATFVYVLNRGAYSDYGLIERKEIPEEVVYPPESDIFEVLSIYPGSGRAEILGPTEAVGIRFSRPINENTFSIRVSPNISFKRIYDKDSNTMYVSPNEYWQIEQTYNFSINATSTEGEALTQDYKFEFTPYRSSLPGIGDEHERSGEL